MFIYVLHCLTCVFEGTYFCKNSTCLTTWTAKVPRNDLRMCPKSVPKELRSDCKWGLLNGLAIWIQFAFNCALTRDQTKQRWGQRCANIGLGDDGSMFLSAVWTEHICSLTKIPPMDLAPGLHGAPPSSLERSESQGILKIGDICEGAWEKSSATQPGGNCSGTQWNGENTCTDHTDPEE